jgi:hypothetical protein
MQANLNLRVTIGISKSLLAISSIAPDIQACIATLCPQILLHNNRLIYTSLRLVQIDVVCIHLQWYLLFILVATC